MQYGLFTMPSHPPERGLFEGHRWDLQTLRWADELGFVEAWIGEHHTAPWEPHPSPDLLIAQALMETRHIRLAPGGFLLPYHHPAELANRVAMLDHMAQGRLNFGVAASGLPSDWAMFNVDGNAGQHREMTREALDIILKLWTTEEPFDYAGKYWQVTQDRPDAAHTAAAHQAVAEALPADRRRRRQQGLGNLEARRRARLPADEPQPQPRPMSPATGNRSRKARGAAGETPAPRRLAAGARDLRRRDATPRPGGCRSARMMGRMMREYFLPLLTDVGVIQFLKHDPSVADSDVTPEYCARHNWLIGSPATVVEKIERMYEEVGGFGSLLLFCFDYSETPEAWRNSMRLLAEEVMPKVAHLTPEINAVARIFGALCVAALSADEHSVI